MDQRHDRAAALLATLLCAWHFGAAAAQVDSVIISSSGPQPPAGSGQLRYPSTTVFKVLLSGLTPGQRYAVRMFASDGAASVLKEQNQALVARGASETVALQFVTRRIAQPGDWKFLLVLDGVQLVERTMRASPWPPIVRAPAPPLTLTVATITPSLGARGTARRPLETLRLPSAVFYHVDAGGFVPGRDYQVQVTVLDGAGRIVRDGRFDTEPHAARHAVWFPIVARATDAAGPWTFRMRIDEQLVSETRITASPTGGVAEAASLERTWPLLAAAVLATLAYVACNFRRYAAPLPPAAGAHPRPHSLGGIFDLSLLALLAANTVPLAVALFMGANAADLLFLYWIENFVVAFYGILRVIRAGDNPRTAGAMVADTLGLLLMMTLFTTAHGTVLYYVWNDSTLFALDPRAMLDPSLANEFARFPREFWDVVPFAIAAQVAILFISHGISFVQDYLQGGEYRTATRKKELGRPLQRMAMVQFAAVACGFYAGSKDSPIALLVLMVLAKTAADAYLHLRQRAENR